LRLRQAGKERERVNHSNNIYISTHTKDTWVTKQGSLSQSSDMMADDDGDCEWVSHPKTTQ